MLIDIARGYVFGRVEASTRKAYEASWGMWVCWRSFVGKGVGCTEGWGSGSWPSLWGNIPPRKGNREKTIAGKLVANNVYHEQFARLSTPV